MDVFSKPVCSRPPKTWIDVALRIVLLTFLKSLLHSNILRNLKKTYLFTRKCAYVHSKWFSDIFFIHSENTYKRIFIFIGYKSDDAKKKIGIWQSLQNLTRTLENL